MAVSGFSVFLNLNLRISLFFCISFAKMDISLLATIAATSLLISRKPRRKKRTIWTKKWLQERESYGDMVLLRHVKNAPDDWRNYLRMDESTFQHLLNMVKPFIAKQDTHMRTSISPEERLSATLRYLATGRSYEDLKFSTRISSKSLSRIIPETCRAISHVLRGQYINVKKSYSLILVF